MSNLLNTGITACFSITTLSVQSLLAICCSYNCRLWCSGASSYYPLSPAANNQRSVAHCERSIKAKICGCQWKEQQKRLLAHCGRNITRDSVQWAWGLEERGHYRISDLTNPSIGYRYFARNKKYHKYRIFNDSAQYRYFRTWHKI